MKPFFSLVIPCYNDGRYAPGYYIDRLLTNILEQGLEKDDLEVIISDDHSIIPYQGTLDRYKEKLNIRFIETDYNFAPGNTRQKGAEIATGQWLCFADHDDVFYKGALAGVKQLIEQKGEQYIVYSDFNKVDCNDITHVIEKFEHPRLGTWIHGKFYNIDNFWKPMQISFKKDLKTHEDLYLGKVVECALHKLHHEPMYIKSPTYMWIYNPDSVSHSNYIAQREDGIEHDFMEIHFNDFLISQIDSILDCYAKDQLTRDEATSLSISGLGSAFLSVCTFKAKNPENYLKTIDAYSSKVLHRMEDELNFNIASLKVMIKTTYSSVLANVNKVADQYRQLPFIEWLEYIDGLDYQSILDPIRASEIRQTNQIQEQSNTIAPISEEADENHRPFYSIVIACYNDGRYKEGVYLDRLLSSLAKQGIPKYDLEVICSDDCSPIPFDSIIAKHENEMIIKYIKTDYNFAPGNTRAKGVTIATGEWLVFADHDDMFYDNALTAMRDAIKGKNEQHFAFGDFYGVDTEGKVVRKFEQSLNWCHAKFYNKDNFWDKYGIHFIKDLKSHEDIAICSQVSCLLSSEVSSYTYLHTPLYAWTDNPQSVSHAKYTVETEEGPREFLEVFFEDYISSTGYIYLNQFKEHKIKIINAIKWCLEIMCYCYFYMQGFEFRRPDDFYQKNYQFAGTYIDECKKTFNLTNESIYNAIASNGAFMYYQIRELADPGSGHYIPSQTLKEWLEIVSPENKKRKRRSTKVEKFEEADVQSEKAN